MVRSALVWLLAGILVGAAMVIDREIPGQWRAWYMPSHVHMLFVGWFLQFALGIAYWLMPRKRSSSRPLGYNERLALGAMIALNMGLLTRVSVEPIERAGHASDTTFAALSVAAALQVAAVAVFVSQLWSRVGPRIRPSAPGKSQSQTPVT
jgi:hypothetical protein